MAELGFRSQISGRPADTTARSKELIGKRSLRFMADAAEWSALAMHDAIADAKLTEEQVSSERTGIIAGSGGPSAIQIVKAADITRKNNSPKRIGPFAVPKAMSSTVSATLATHFKIKGVNYSITSACTTSLHCIGAACEQIQWGKQDVMFAGGGEEVEWAMSSLFDAMGAMSSKYNDAPETASRAFDANRDGFVIAGGAGMVVLEDYDHAVARGAKIYAEITGYAATSDGDTCWRCCRNQRYSPRIRRRRTLYLSNQMPNGAQPRRSGRTGGDLLAHYDGSRLRGPVNQYHRS